MNTPNKQRKKAALPKGIEADYNYLNKQNSEILQLKFSESILFQANFAYLSRWQRINDKEIKKLYALRHEIDKDFFQYTIVDATVEFIYPTEKKEGLPLFKDGKTKEDFEAACKQLGETKCIVIP